METKQKKIEVNKENPYVLLMTYGTLRVGCGNYNHLLKDKSEFIGTYNTEPNFTMYGRNSGFPIVTNGKTSIEYDLFKIDKDEVLQRIHALEGFSGYIDNSRNWYNVRPIETPHGLAHMYIQDDYKGNQNNIIESGNWFKK